ncbi:MAG: hypothetical protein WAM91_09565 [Candidatus Acidiferrales bacterium]
MEKSLNLELDNNLRLLYSSLRYKGGTLLAIKFSHRGKRFEVDTPEEATRLLQHLEEEDRNEVEQGDMTREDLLREKTKWTADRFVDLVQHIGIAQKTFLAALLDSSGGVRAEIVARKVGAPSSMVLAGIQSGLAKQVRAIGLEPIDLYRVHITWTEGERKRFLTLDEGFRLAAEDSDWPPQDIQKRLKEVKK